jgi:FkbM family methyltransferase
VGASYGTYSLSACSMGATVYSFEPEKTVFDDLVTNVNINHWNDRCFPANVGLWSYSTVLHMNSYAPHWSALSISSNYKMHAMDQIVKDNKIEKVDWIKIDVEGAEEHVIQGGLQTIKKYHPKLIIECHTFLDKDIKDNIRKLLSIYDYSFEEVDRDPCIMLIAK